MTAADADAQVADAKPDAKLDADTAEADGIDVDSDATSDALDGSDGAGVDSTDAGTDAGPDIAKDCPAGPFCTCKTDSDCDSGKCLETPDGLTCAPTCAESGCPSGYTCKSLGGGDPLNYCVASHLSLCAPCQTNKDCQAQGVTSALCLDYGDAGHFCGGACATDNDCGPGYTCADVPDPTGGTTKQCKASSGLCSCSAWAKTAGTVTACSNTNAAGICKGTRSCTATGLTACSAATPATETCNNQDDDCNGTPDDLPVDATCGVSAWSASGSGSKCTSDTDCAEPGEGCDPAGQLCHKLIGTCTGKHVCVGGTDVCQGAKTPKLESCNGEDDNCDGATDEAFSYYDVPSGATLPIGSPCGLGACAGGQVVCLSFGFATCGTAGLAQVETCNGIDDDCDGQSDETTCSDANACTADVCDGAASTCQHLPVQGSCDDGDPCTLADACTGTTCTGSQKPCEDGNPCTADSCDALSGVCVFTQQSGSCADGNACTSGDQCGAIAGGGWGCLAGAAIDCNDNNPCTDDSCDTGLGCSYKTNNYSQPCYEGPSITSGVGQCHSGLRYCVAGVLEATCKDQVVPVTAEQCDGLDDSCDGITDEGCSASSVALSFAAAQTTGKSGVLLASVQWAPDRPAALLQDAASPNRLALGLLAWFARLMAGN